MSTADVAVAVPGTDGAQAETQPLRQLDMQQVRTAIEDVKKALLPVANELSFSIDQDSGRTLVRIVDLQTDEVIRQIPSEEIVRISKALDRLQGLLLNQEA